MAAKKKSTKSSSSTRKRPQKTVTKRPVTQRSKRRPKRKITRFIGALLCLMAVAYIVGRYGTFKNSTALATPTPQPSVTSTPVSSVQGQLVSPGTPQVLTTSQISSEVRWRYGSLAPTPKYDVSVQTIIYTSANTDGSQLTEYARVYIPQGISSTPGVISFGPGTTGIGESCASSLEQPMVENLGDYNAHYLAYASQGNVVIATDYDGFRDTSRTHDYMVGDLEGRALLDSVRAARQLSDSHSWANQPVFLLGYSQGGQAAFWADQIDKTYAPDVRIAGLVAFAPVSNVLQTWQDILHGSTADWFGPYLLASYSNYYQADLGISQILLPKWVPNLRTDALSHCINSAPAFYGTNAGNLYTPTFLAALASGNLSSYGFNNLAAEIEQQNITTATSTPKLLLQGLADTTILPTQTAAMKQQLCQMKSGAVSEQTFNGATHYSIIPTSFNQSLAWINARKAGQPAPSSC